MEIFDLYFASLMSMTLHPGFNKPDTPKPTMDQIAQMALDMMELREKIWQSH